MKRRSVAGEKREHPGVSSDGGDNHSRKGLTKWRERAEATRGTRAFCHRCQSRLTGGGLRVGEEWESRWGGGEPFQKDSLM